MSVISITGLTHFYNKGTPFESVAIHDINLEIQKGELLAIIGHTGSGKSTLIQHFNGLLKPDKGVVKFNGSDIWENKKHIREVRFNVGLCFQYPEYQLFEETVYKDIAFGPQNMKLDESEIDRRVRKAAEFVGLKDELLEKSPFDLSGGEKRRAAIAGVLAMEPSVLIMDEPTAGLDPRGREKIIQLIKKYREETGSTVVLVSHSMEDVARLADRILVMENGSPVMLSSVKSVFSQRERLVSMGLNVPQIAQVFSGLRSRGLPVSADIFTVEEGVKELLRVSQGRGIQ